MKDARAMPDERTRFRNYYQLEDGTVNGACADCSSRDLADLRRGDTLNIWKGKIKAAYLLVIHPKPGVVLP